MKKIIRIFQIYFGIIILLFLSSCQTTGSSSYNSSVSHECRMARSQHQICYGNCLMVTPGSTLAVMSQCGYKCSDTSMRVAYACN